MHRRACPPIHFTALRWFDIQKGPGRVIAVLFAPAIHETEQEATSDSNEYRSGYQANAVADLPARHNVLHFPAGRLVVQAGDEATHG